MMTSVLRAALTGCVLIVMLVCPARAQTDPANEAWQAGDTERAAQLYEQRLEQNPTDIVALHRLALIRAWSDRFDESLALFDRLLRVDPRHLDARVDRARVLAWAARYPEAERAYTSMLEANPQDVQALLGLAIVRSWQGDTDAAEPLYRRILEIDPTNLDALRGLARAAAWGGDLREGERRWRRALEIVPQDVESMTGLAQTLRWQGRDAAALEVVQRALAIAPADAGAREQLRWLRTTTAPRVLPGVVYEHDSDGNRITSWTAGAAWRPQPRLEVRIDGYLRDARAVTNVPELAFRAGGATATLMRQFEPGWTVSVHGGASATDAAGDDARASWGGSLTTPGRNRTVLSLSANRAALDATALLVRQRVTTTDASATLATALPWQVRLRASGSVTRFDGDVSGQRNTRTAGSLSLARRVLPPLTIALQGRAFTFDRDDIRDGYFSPDFYGIAEASAQLAREYGRWGWSLELAPGIQQVRTEGDITGTLRAAASLQFMPRPDRAIILSGTFANAGLNSLSPDAVSEYRYRSIGVSTRWGF